MPLDALEIKYLLLRRDRTLVNAAAKLSDKELSFNADLLSKVIRGERRNPVIRERIAQRIGKSAAQVFGKPKTYFKSAAKAA